MPAETEARRIALGSRTLVYTLERKRVKNINLRVRPDGSVYVSCPYLTPIRRVEAFLRAESGRILAALDRIETAALLRPEAAHCAEGEAVSVWGETVTLRFRSGRGDGALLGGELWLPVRNPDDEAQRRRALERWQRQSCEETLTALCRRLYPAFAARGVAWPELRFRRMRSRWGSCQTRRGVITFNLRLVELPEACALYVAAHELTHFLQPNHSSAFYAELARVLPDWAERRALLRQWE